MGGRASVVHVEGEVAEAAAPAAVAATLAGSGEDLSVSVATPHFLFLRLFRRSYARAQEEKRGQDGEKERERERARGRTAGKKFGAPRAPQFG